MNLRNVALTAAAVVVATAGAASAGTSVTNSYSTRNVYNGRSRVDFNVSSYKSYRQYNSSQSIKVETYGGDVNVSNASFNGVNLTGSAHSSNRRVVDPVSIISTSKQTEYVYGSERATQRGTETYSFTGKERSHTVSSDSF